MKKLKTKKGHKNILEIDELKKKIREGKTKCVVEGCEYIAVDVDHLNEDHSDNRPENLSPICKIHHNEKHDITPIIDELGALVRTFYRIQEIRKATSNQIFAYSNIHYPVKELEIVKEPMEKIELKLNKQIGKLVKEHIFWDEAKKVMGLSHILFANLVSEIADPRRFANPSKVWKYFGLHTDDGKAVKRKRGVVIGFSIKRRSLVWKIGDSFNKVRNKGKMGKLLAEYHEFYTKRDGEKLSKGHCLNRARRKAVKIFLACFWAKWMELLGEKPVPVFPEAKLNHKNIKHWDDIIS